ncbi:hypothetical protein FR5810_01630 [Bordetella pertussis]|nr:Uncharacterised protein [Bordetella pertussis]CFL81993.1 Uncharacterised protein [Bordetella pertussis]CFM90877.1 Uncharacterised protein [Bordetella pertussis]CFO29763.1 Uncharacterised protein [Bordetella pertussis]CFO32710.1 Uncharacterised protein [Bordetella pertussis]
MHHFHPPIAGGQFPGHRDRLRILVEHHQARLRAQPGQQRTAVSAAAERAVDEDAVLQARGRIRPRLAGLTVGALAAEIRQHQRVNRRLQQHGPMFEFHIRLQNEN